MDISIGEIKVATIQMLKREAKKIGATVEKDSGGRYCTWQVTAPEGFQFTDGGTESLRVEWAYGDSAWRDDAIQEALLRMGCGMEAENDD
jgi:hypothetical protein